MNRDPVAAAYWHKMLPQILRPPIATTYTTRSGVVWRLTSNGWIQEIKR